LTLAACSEDWKADNAPNPRICRRPPRAVVTDPGDKRWAARRSNAEREAAADIGVDQAVGHLPMHRRKKLGAAAMHRDDHVRRQPLELGYRVIDIILRRRAEMKPAEDRVQLATPDTAMAAFTVLISPTWPHEEMTTSPRPLTM